MDERGRFEKWAQPRSFLLMRDKRGNYELPHTDEAWTIWQASLAERDARVEEMRKSLKELYDAALKVVSPCLNCDGGDEYERCTCVEYVDDCKALGVRVQQAERILAQTAPTVPAPVKEG